MSTFLIYFSSDNATFSRDTSPPQAITLFLPLSCLEEHDEHENRAEGFSHLCILLGMVV